MRVVKDTKKPAYSQLYTKANNKHENNKAFIPSSHKQTSLPTSSSKTARPEQKPLEHVSSSPTSNKFTDPKSKSPQVKNTSPHVKSETAGIKSTSAKDTTVSKSHTPSKKVSEHKPKTSPAVKTSEFPTSDGVQIPPEPKTSPAPHITVGSSTSSYTLKGKKAKDTAKAQSKSSSASSEYKRHSDEKTLGDNTLRFSFQGSASNERPYKDLPTHPLENEAVEKHYALLTLSILKSLFNKHCDCDKPNLLFFKVKSRPTVARCSSCHKQVSITANTPLHKFQLPLCYFSYILHDAILQYPKVITSSEISRKLNLPYKTAYFLKRRLQVITSMLNTKLRENLKSELTQYAEEHPLTLPKGEDLKPLLEDYPIASADVVVLYSSSVKANKYRSRRFRTGSSSIYRSNNLGGEQVGTMVHTIGVKGSYTFYKSIPLTKQEYLLDDLDTVIPRSIPLFTDEGYKFIWDRKNHRMVNQSKRSSDPRYNMSRERWVTKEGVSSNIAEGRNNILKQAFRSYYYVSPKWSQVYLDELSFLGNLRYNKDLARLFFTGSYTEGEEITCSGYTVNKQLSLKKSASDVKPSSAIKYNVKSVFTLGKLETVSDSIVGSSDKICSKDFYPLLTQFHLSSWLFI